ncbi:MAG: Flp pilus assembly protein CpaB [Chloroflexi bacterium]|nr:Flp pilus assembly protein CpaB [Chloroflexota bacterium]
MLARRGPVEPAPWAEVGDVAAATLSPTRALRPPRRLPWRAIFGVFLLLLATGGSIAFWTSSSDTRAVLVATREVPAGAVLSAADLAVAQVQVDDAIYRAVVPADELAVVVGKQLAEPLHPQQMLVRAQVSTRSLLGTGELALTIPVTPETAVGGALRPGDAVQVLLTVDKGTPEARTIVVLPRAVVYAIGHEERTTSVNTGSPDRLTAQGPARWLTLVVTDEQGVRLVQGRWAGELDVALLPAESQ